MAALSKRTENQIDLHLSGVAITLRGLVAQGWVEPKEMAAAIDEYVEGNPAPLDDLIAAAAEETLYNEEDELVER